MKMVCYTCKTMKPQIHTLKNKAGMTLKVSTLGGIVTSLLVPDRDGKLGDVVLGLPKVEQHHDNGYMNALIGRVGNRISHGGFSLDGTFHKLAQNSVSGGVKCSLHGGENGFDRKIWSAREFAGAEGPSLELTCFSADGEEGYPGNLFVRVVYTVMEDNAWRIDYWAVADKPTVVNLTNHAYFNLSGGREGLDEHLVQVNASRYTEVDKGLIPTGKVPSVKGTPLDLRSPVVLGDVFAKAKKEPLLKLVGGGFDHNFVLDRAAPGLAQAAILEDPCSGRQMEVWTTEPCIQVYSGNFIKAGTKGKDGAVYGPHAGICFETQHAPDSPNQPGFASIRLEPGETYRSTTVYAFDVVA